MDGGWITVAIYFAFFLLVFYFLIIFPRKKQEKAHNELLDGLRTREKVVTIGGMHGEISKIKDDSVILKVHDGTEIEFLKKAIAYRAEDQQQ
ncbi:Protein translocase subunit YajC [Candidatus Syntrophocurvum alkaliphilum]|uniref:Protein translocase subunit YajC n=1 Tax=Candidatus Syntrophocurvum alkaliphilum TaxID=2293317 RepID=A0A6I6DCD7_9FIRM|nr:preprotein translocase subunit YajC [Candidatus Syntrophocurvum alkaliphilum]QGT99909.1 Protein translocase subunit YajC [Candidatus Syntrophocurvum alkaliphilum]